MLQKYTVVLFKSQRLKIRSNKKKIKWHAVYGVPTLLGKPINDYAANQNLMEQDLFLRGC
jgi:hypothetical protein